MSSASKCVEEDTVLTEIRNGYKVGSSKALNSGDFQIWTSKEVRTVALGRRGLWSNMRDIVLYLACTHAVDREVISGSAVHSEEQVGSCIRGIEFPAWTEGPDVPSGSKICLWDSRREITSIAGHTRNLSSSVLTTVTPTQAPCTDWGVHGSPSLLTHHQIQVLVCPFPLQLLGSRSSGHAALWCLNRPMAHEVASHAVKAFTWLFPWQTED